MKKHFISLVNNERTNIRIASKKGNNCTGGATDVCYVIDSVHCGTYAYDVCNKDYAACQKGADDTCYIDHTYCTGPGQEDNT